MLLWTENALNVNQSCKVQTHSFKTFLLKCQLPLISSQMREFTAHGILYLLWPYTNWCSLVLQLFVTYVIWAPKNLTLTKVELRWYKRHPHFNIICLKSHIDGSDFQKSHTSPFLDVNQLYPLTTTQPCSTTQPKNLLFPPNPALWFSCQPRTCRYWLPYSYQLFVLASHFLPAL